MPTLIYELTLERDRDELRMAEGLDIKAGILLALTAVLVTINGALLADSHLTKRLQVDQLIALGLAALSALLSCAVVIYRFYERSEKSASIRRFIEKIERSGLNVPSVQIQGMEIKEALTRSLHNYKVNRIRYALLILGFVPAVVSLLIDIVTIALHALACLP
jgi:hypothetical protein